MTNINLWHNNLPGTVEDNLKVLDELGGPKHFNHYAWGWTFAGNTPFRRWKRETYRGGISDPLIVHWRIREIIEKKSCAIPIRSCDRPRTHGAGLPGYPTAPTTIRGVTQSPIEGVSFAQSFMDGEVPSKHHHPILRDDGTPVYLP